MNEGLNEALPLPEALQPYSSLIVGAALALTIFVIGWIASKWAHALCLRVMRKRSVDEALARFLSAIVQYAVLAAALITALGKVGVETTSLVAIFASAGLAIGLALQGSLGSFASGVMILFFRPFTLGDKVTVGGQTAKVEDIGLFATTMVTSDNEQVIMPNSSITSDCIVNHTTRGTLRGNIAVGVSYGTDLQKAMEIMVNSCRTSELVLSDPEPSVAMTGFGASSIDFVVRPWATSGDYLDMLHNVSVKLYDDLNAAGIEIPFNQIVVHNA